MCFRIVMGHWFVLCAKVKGKTIKSLSVPLPRIFIDNFYECEVFCGCICMRNILGEKRYKLITKLTAPPKDNNDCLYF